jgi:queuine tRNA-ribosyltransferase
MTEPYAFTVSRTDGAARLGEITTAHGRIRTPAFMPVGTAATVKAVYVEQLEAAGADVILGNTYHLMLRPGAERIGRLGGLHAFLGWNRPILTDSGGYQVMSLSKLRKVTDTGVVFRSHIDGSEHQLSPERAIEVQCLLGADIQMQLDECLALPATDRDLRTAVDRSIAWAARSQSAFAEQQTRGQATAGQGSCCASFF